MKEPALTTRSQSQDRAGLFASTRWTVVLSAGDENAPSAQSLNALSELCRIYWRPIYLFLRKQGFRLEDAQDLTQGFFVSVIETRTYARAEREKGKFRSFLLGALKHYVANERDRDRAQKRGGGLIHEELDDKAIAEVEKRIERMEKWSGDEIYDREWAASLLRQALDRLAQESSLAGKEELFVFLKPYLSVTADEAVPYEIMAQRFHRAVTTLRSDVARLRARYRTILRDEVRGTLLQPEDLDEELRHLCCALVRA